MKINNKIYRFNDLFYPIEKGTFGLTDKAIYESIKYGGRFIPFWGGQQNHDEEERFVSINAKNINSKSINVFSGECLIISFDGSAGSMTYKPREKEGEKFIFSLNHHAGTIKVKDPSLIDIVYFKYKYEPILKNIAISEGSKTISIKQLKKINFDLYDLPIQKLILKRYKKLDSLKNNLIMTINNIDKITSKTLDCEYISRMVEQVPLSKILEYTSRNDSLSEEGIYNRSINIKSSKFKIVVISGNVNEIYGTIPFDENLHYLSGKTCLQVVTRGVNAGYINILPVGTYATNTNAMLLSIKSKMKDVVNINNLEQEIIYLKFLRIYLQSFFLDYRSSGDHSVFPLSEAIENLKVPFFKYEEEMKMIVEKYNKLENYRTFCNNILSNISDLFSKQVVV